MTSATGEQYRRLGKLASCLCLRHARARPDRQAAKGLLQRCRACPFHHRLSVSAGRGKPSPGRQFVGWPYRTRMHANCPRARKIHGSRRSCRGRAPDRAQHASCRRAGPRRCDHTPKPHGTRDFVGTRCALASEPGAQQAVLRTLRAFISFGGFRRRQIAALQAALPTMKQPTLIIWGRQDKLVPADHARILEGKLQRASTILFDNCGHFPQVEQPQLQHRRSRFLA